MTVVLLAPKQCRYGFLDILTNIYVPQELHVEWLADDIGLANREQDLAAIIAIMKGFKDVLGIISRHIVVTFDRTGPVSWRGFRK